MKRAGMVLIAAVILAAAAGGAFWAGTRFGENRVLQDPARFFQQRGMGQMGGFTGRPGTAQPGPRSAQGMDGGTAGTIESIEGDGLVVSTEEGTIRVQTTDTTLIEKSMTVKVGDLEVGEGVVVSGSRNDDGSLTARSIRSMQGFMLQQSQHP